MKTIYTPTEARAALYTLLNAAQETHHPIRIQGRDKSAVLISEENWEAIQETLYLLAIPGMRASIRKGLKQPVRTCAKGLVW